MVLLLSLQFAAAVHFMWKDDLTCKFRCDAIHLAYALFKEHIVLPWGTGKHTTGGVCEFTPNI